MLQPPPQRTVLIGEELPTQTSDSSNAAGLLAVPLKDGKPYKGFLPVLLGEESAAVADEADSERPHTEIVYDVSLRRHLEHEAAQQSELRRHEQRLQARSVHDALRARRRQYWRQLPHAVAPAQEHNEAHGETAPFSSVLEALMLAVLGERKRMLPRLDARDSSQPRQLFIPAPPRVAYIHEGHGQCSPLHASLPAMTPCLQNGVPLSWTYRRSQR